MSHPSQTEATSQDNPRSYVSVNKVDTGFLIQLTDLALSSLTLLCFGLKGYFLLNVENITENFQPSLP